MGKKIPKSYTTESSTVKEHRNPMGVRDITNYDYMIQYLNRATNLIDSVDNQLTEVSLGYENLKVEKINQIAKIYDVVTKDIAGFRNRIKDIRNDFKDNHELDLFDGLVLTTNLSAIIAEIHTTIIPNIKEINSIIEKEQST